MIGPAKPGDRTLGVSEQVERPALMPERTGLIVADRYDAAILREAQSTMLAPARRKVETLRFARRAARRLLVSIEAEDETAF